MPGQMPEWIEFVEALRPFPMEGASPPHKVVYAMRIYGMLYEMVMHLRADSGMAECPEVATWLKNNELDRDGGRNLALAISNLVTHYACHLPHAQLLDAIDLQRRGLVARMTTSWLSDTQREAMDAQVSALGKLELDTVALRDRAQRRLDRPNHKLSELAVKLQQNCTDKYQDSSLARLFEQGERAMFGIEHMS